MTTASRGAAAEREAKRELEAAGWWAMRSPASKGAVDLVALRRAGRVHVYEGQAVAWFVQVKTTSKSMLNDFGPADRAALVAEAERAGALPVLAWRRPRGRWQWRYVTTEGATEEALP